MYLCSLIAYETDVKSDQRALHSGMSTSFIKAYVEVDILSTKDIVSLLKEVRDCLL